MSTITEVKRVLRGLPAAELESIADWLEWEVAQSQCRESRVPEGQSVRASEEPLFMSWDEYLAFEEQSSRRHEYVNGTVYAISTESLAHDCIAQRLVVAFRSQLRGRSKEPFFLQVKLEIRNDINQIMYYPDVMVCSRPKDWMAQSVRDPQLVVEILSNSTQHIDRREKAMTYQRVETIEEYALIAQSQPRVIIHRRSEGWRPMLYSSMDARVEFRSIGVHIPLMQLYEGSLE
jgi:Uma2 family endonuclease